MYDEVYNNKYGFDIPDEHIPSDDDMRRLADRDESVVSELVSGLTSFIISEMEWFIKKNPQAECYTEDIFSEAMLALSAFVQESLGEKYAPTQFIGFAKKECLNKVSEWLVITGLPVTIPTGSLFHKDRQDKVDAIKSQSVREEDRQTSPDGLFSEVWFDDFIDSLTEEDQTILRMKLGGASNSKIGQAIGLEHHHVANRLSKLLARYAGE